MKKFLVVIAIAGVFTACGNGSESSTTTEDSIRMADSMSKMNEGNMMSSDSSKMMSDSSSKMMEDSSSKMMSDSMK